MTHPSGHFSGHNILALKECFALKFLYALEIHQASLASAHLNGEGVPKNVNRENLKFGLEFSVCAPITSGLVGSVLTKLLQATKIHHDSAHIDPAESPYVTWF